MRNAFELHARANRKCGRANVCVKARERRQTERERERENKGRDGEKETMRDN